MNHDIEKLIPIMVLLKDRRFAELSEILDEERALYAQLSELAALRQNQPIGAGEAVVPALGAIENWQNWSARRREALMADLSAVLAARERLKLSAARALGRVQVIEKMADDARNDELRKRAAKLAME